MPPHSTLLHSTVTVCPACSVFTIHVEATNAGGHQERAVQSKINLVDLAGSERTKKTGVGGQTLVEASYINKSLTFLEQVRLRGGGLLTCTS